MALLSNPLMSALRPLSGGEGNPDIEAASRTSEIRSNSRANAVATATLATGGEADHENCRGVVASPHRCTDQGAMLRCS